MTTLAYRDDCGIRAAEPRATPYTWLRYEYNNIVGAVQQVTPRHWSLIIRVQRLGSATFDSTLRTSDVYIGIIKGAKTVSYALEVTRQ
jgi:hypothetical protein